MESGNKMKYTVKRLFAVLTAAAVLLSAAAFSACGEKEDEQEPDPTKAPSASEDAPAPDGSIGGKKGTELQPSPSGASEPAGGEAADVSSETDTAPSSPSRFGDRQTTAPAEAEKTQPSAPEGSTAPPASEPQTQQPAADGGETQSQPDYASCIALAASAKSARPGDTVRVDVLIRPTKNVACFDIAIRFDADVFTLTETEEGRIQNFQFLDNTGKNSANAIRISGFTAKTVDFNNDTVYSLVLTVKDGVSAGPTAVSANATLFLVGTDPSGVKTVDVAAENDISANTTVSIVG